MKNQIRLLLVAGTLALVSTGGFSLREASFHDEAAFSAVSEDFVHATPLNAYRREAYSGSYYSSIDLDSTGDALLQSLRTLTVNNYEGSSYDGLKTGLPKICLPADGSSYMVGFYNRAHLTTSWDGGSTWNREHTWPNSRGAGTSGAGSNPFVIMPTSVSVNSSRGNLFYGAGGSNTWDPGQYDEQFRGAAARCILYAAMHYENLSLSENPGDASSKNTMGVKSLLLEWNKTYAPDDDESYRNELTAENYGVRNPFIDYPYLADNIWGNGTSTDPSSSTSSSLPQTETNYSLMTSSLQDGDKFMIGNVADGAGYALSKYSVNDTRPWYKSAESMTVSSGDAEPPSSAGIFTAAASGSGFTLTEETQGKLIAYTSGTHTSIGYETDTITADATNDVWDVTVSSDGAATLSSTVGTSTIYLAYQLYTTSYNSTPEFLGSTSSYNLYLFKEAESGDDPDPSTNSSSSANSSTISSQEGGASIPTSVPSSTGGETSGGATLHPAALVGIIVLSAVVGGAIVFLIMRFAKKKQ